MVGRCHLLTKWCDLQSQSPLHLALGEDLKLITYASLFFSCSMARREKQKPTKIWDQQNKQASSGKECCKQEQKYQKDTSALKNSNLLSFVGSVFFSCVSVFFSLVLSNWEISLMFGLSAIVLLQFIYGEINEINYKYMYKACHKQISALIQDITIKKVPNLSLYWRSNKKQGDTKQGSWFDSYIGFKQSNLTSRQLRLNWINVAGAPCWQFCSFIFIG